MEPPAQVGTDGFVAFPGAGNVAEEQLRIPVAAGVRAEPVVRRREEQSVFADEDDAVRHVAVPEVGDEVVRVVQLER